MLLVCLYGVLIGMVGRLCVILVCGVCLWFVGGVVFVNVEVYEILGVFMF